MKTAKTLLILSIVYMIGFYILKFIFPEYLLLVVTNPTILSFGEFINSWKGYEYILTTITTLITFYLFSCASTGKFKRSVLEFVVIVLSALINKVVILFLPELSVHTSTSLMFLIAFVCKGKIQYTAPAFIVYGYISQFILSIRGFETVMQYMTPVSGVIIGLECWVILLIFSYIHNIKENKNGRICTTICK